MILSENFRLLRLRAIEKLSGDARRDSFAYHIDINNAWDYTYSTTELTSYLGIHTTHKDKFSELCYDLLTLGYKLNVEQARLHLKIVDKVAGQINTNKNFRPNYKYDIGELLIDWDFLKEFAQEFKTAIDFGAGCGRQVIGLLSNSPKFNRLYTIDASTNGYITQNILFSVCATLEKIDFIDLLDFEEQSEITSLSKILEKVQPGLPTVVHFPAWQDYDLIENNSVDIIFACHVHNELSRSDFLRLIRLANEKVRSGGYIYVRSELGIWGDTFYEDNVFYHAIDPVEILLQHGFEVVKCEYFGAFQTTLFQKSKSSPSASENPHSTKIEKKASNELTKPSSALSSFKDCTFYAAHHFNHSILSRLLSDYHMVNYVKGSYPDMLSQVPEKTRKNIKVLSPDDFTGKLDETYPTVIAHHAFDELERLIPIEQKKFFTRIQYTLPIVYFVPNVFDFDTEKMVVLKR